MKNYRDVGTSTSDLSAGFQYEFFCESCGETWRSPFRPYRKGQVTGWLMRFAFMFYDLQKVGRGAGAFADAGAASARNEALAEALVLAKDRYHECESCRKWVCEERCFDDRAGVCTTCAKNPGRSSGNSPYGADDANAAAPACPNCQTPSQGGRFCHECGFDMASTHKSCPACGVTQARSARFCGDCGHGF